MEKIMWKKVNMDPAKVIMALSFVLLMVLTLPARAEDPDYGNDCNVAEPIDPDGTIAEGTLSTTGDEDWFSFTADAYGLYEITLQSQSGNKYLELYGPDGCETQQKIANFYTSTGTKTEELLISTAGTYYVRIYNGTGLYNVSVDEVGVYDADAYADTCADANELVVDGDPASDAITDWGADEDWLFFDSETLHRYQITLTKSFTSNIVFDLYSEDCQTNLKTNQTSLTIVSWDGANYNLRVHSSNFTKEGYYQISVTDLGEEPDDHGNTCDAATPIDTSGTPVEGNLQYTGATMGNDEDWFSFPVAAYGLYEITLHSQASHKYLEVYGPDDCGTQQKIANFYTSTGTKTEELLISAAGTYYLRVYNGTGLYHVSVNEAGVYATDAYADTCLDANEIVVDGEPASDGITNWGADEDWLTFPAGVLHKYEVTLTPSFTSDVVFDLYDYDCETSLKANKTSLTFVSWYDTNRNLRVHSRNFAKEGYYDVQVDDLGQQPDDHANTAGESTGIPTNGVMTEGDLQYTADLGSDEDWFVFVAPVDGLHQITLWSQAGYKYLVGYSLDELYQLHEITSFHTSNEITKDISITAGVYLLKVHKGSGLYRVGVLSPEPQCGDSNHPYPSGDLNHDCVVNFLDVGLVAANWLADNRP